MESYNILSFVSSFFAEHIVFKAHPCFSMYHYLTSFCGQIICYHVDVSHFVYSLVGRHLDSFHFLAITKNAVMKNYAHIFVWMHFHFSWVYM